MFNPGITTTQLMDISNDLRNFLDVANVVVSLVPNQIGLEIDIDVSLGKDLDKAELKTIIKNIADAATDRLDKEFSQPTYRVLVKNLDTDKVITALFKHSDKKTSLYAEASLGDDRDELVKLLATARNSLLEAMDTLYDAKNLAERSVSKKIATDLQEKIINQVDGATSSAIDALREVIKSLSTTSLSYEEK